LTTARAETLAREKSLLPTPVLATAIFIVTELMLFGGFLSAYAIAQTNVATWPPAGQPRLPVEATAVNTLALLVSGVLMYVASVRFGRDPRSARAPMAGALSLGAFFVLFQGYEWVGLINEGLTLQVSNHAGFFYLIVGAHALHAIGGLVALGVIYMRLSKDRLTWDVLWAGRLFWYFVVGLWPFLYWQVYL
jgi:cytochrome c oxidase subunit 3